MPPGGVDQREPFVPRMGGQRTPEDQPVEAGKTVRAVVLPGDLCPAPVPEVGDLLFVELADPFPDPLKVGDGLSSLMCVSTTGTALQPGPSRSFGVPLKGGQGRMFGSGRENNLRIDPGTACS
jgi:hypothetical protein